MEGVLSADWVIPVDAPPIRDGAVAFRDGRIEAVGPAAELGAGRRYPEAAIIPGFVNAHAHLEYSAYAGFGDGLDFPSWLALHMARKRRLEPAEVDALARLGAAECLASGVTTVADASYSGAAAAACAGLGLRAIVHLEVFGADPEAARARFEAACERVAGAFSDRVRPGVSPHAPYSCSLAVYEWCRSLDLPLQTHLAESEAERDYLLHGSGPLARLREHFVDPPGETGVRLLARAGLLGPGTSAAHCVTVDAEEIALLAAHRVGVVHCPRSNGVLGCGTAPVRALRAAGAAVGLGTDSPASAPSFDLFEELRTAIVLARARELDCASLAAGDALELATLGAARALGLEAEVGSLAPGKRADLAVVSLADSPWLPWEDPVAAVVFGGSPGRVSAVYVGGQLTYDPEEFEWRDLRQEARAARSRMLRAASPAAPPRPRAGGSSSASTSSGGRSRAPSSS